MAAFVISYVFGVGYLKKIKFTINYIFKFLNKL